MSENQGLWNKFFTQRSHPLASRFPGHYRALVVETNDPLNAYRIRFKCPDLHDHNLPDNECPWAVPSPALGGKRAGQWTHPCRGDWVWITFERDHPYGPIWTGFATPTRRRFYPYLSLSQTTPLSIDEQGRPAGQPKDYAEEYLPKDGRPMSQGWQDRYGNLDIHSSVGFYPEEHKQAPPEADYDPVQRRQFQQRAAAPAANQPDKKYMARITKYGNMWIMSDQGYWWQRGDDEYGEFKGNCEQDEQFELKRSLFLQKLLNEGQPDSTGARGDCRRIGFNTRYGHKLEARDTGWAQPGPHISKSRRSEFNSERFLSKETEADFRWIKLRTKAGMLFQAYDKGADPHNDKWIKRSLLEEVGDKTELEYKYWHDKDARWMRLVTRHGFKLVLDDRGSSPTDARGLETPRGNGILLKGRRSPGAKGDVTRGNQRGFWWEFNENDLANHTSWGSPLGLAVELNDRYQYMMLAATKGPNWSTKWRHIKENEFIRKPLMFNSNPELTAHHLKLDHENEYIRLKTRAGKGPEPLATTNVTGVGQDELNQGVEFHDGNNGSGPWVELVDCQNRGMWFSKSRHLGIWRAKRDTPIYAWIDDSNHVMALYNGSGKLKLYAKNIEIVSDGEIALSAATDLKFRCGGAIKFQSGNGRMTLNSDLQVSGNVFGAQLIGFYPGVMPGGGAGNPAPGGDAIAPISTPQPPEILEPDDRAKTYNGPFEECPIEEVEHPDP